MIDVRELPRSALIADRLMWPLMFALGGFRRDSIQETHFWHNQRIDKSQIDSRLTVVISGDVWARQHEVEPCVSVTDVSCSHFRALAELCDPRTAIGR